MVGLASQSGHSIINHTGSRCSASRAIALGHLHAAEEEARRELSTRSLTPGGAAKRGHAQLHTEGLGADRFSFTPLLRIETPDFHRA
jgi:hypothetical protein